MFSKVTGSDLCEEPIKNQIKFWRTRIISRDFEPFPKNWGHLIVVDDYQQIFCNKKIDPLLFKTITEETNLLDEYRREYIFPF